MKAADVFRDIQTVRRSIDEFAEGEPQFDDITQVCLYYAGEKPKQIEEEMAFDADAEKLYDALSFVESRLDEAGCGRKEKKQISMAVEEIFVNVASYAYPPDVKDGKVWVRLEIRDRAATVTISDAGAPYDPLKKPDPDLAMDVEDRQHGGFGIYMVKNAMDEVTYARQDDRNVLTIRKSWNA